MSRPNIDQSSRNTRVSWTQPQSLADPSDFSYNVQVISTSSIVIQNTNTTNTTLSYSPTTGSTDCMGYFVRVTPIASGGMGEPNVTDNFIFLPGG